MQAVFIYTKLNIIIIIHMSRQHRTDNWTEPNTEFKYTGTNQSNKTANEGIDKQQVIWIKQ